MNRSALAAGALWAVVSSLSTELAHADGPASDALRDIGVAMRDGASFRGELIEKIPGDHLTIKLASGDVRRLAWADIADVAVAKEKDKGDKDADAKPSIHLVVDGKPGLLLERRQTAAEGWTATVWPAYSYVETWEVACVAPCRTVVDADSTYRVNGDGATTSRNFTLPQGRESLRLRLVPRSALAHGGALALILTGVAFVAVGASGVLASPALSDSTIAMDLRGLGYGAVGVGAAAIAIGIPLWLLTYSVARTDDDKVLGLARPLLSF